MEKSFLAFIEESIKKNWDLDALTDYKGATLQYKDVARKIEKLHILLAESGIQPGDKVAICGRNSSHWGVAFLAILTYGAVAVPILHEFKADNIHNIVNHSGARLLFAGDVIWESLDEKEMPQLEGIILMTDFTLLVCRSKQLEYAREHLNELFGRKFPRNFRREHVSYRRDETEELAVINYTSGTTSASKGVMIPYRALWSNTQFAFEVLPLKPGDRVVSMLPMAHIIKTQSREYIHGSASYVNFLLERTCIYFWLSNFYTKLRADVMFTSSPVCQVRRLSSRLLQK